MNISHGCSISVSHMKSFSKLWSSVIKYNRFNPSTCIILLLRYWITFFLWTHSFSKQTYIASTAKFILKYDINARFQYWHEIDEIIKIVISILVWNIKKKLCIFQQIIDRFYTYRTIYTVHRNSMHNWMVKKLFLLYFGTIIPNYRAYTNIHFSR